MTEEEVIAEGRKAGIDFWEIYDWTWGEIQEYLMVDYERRREEYKQLSIISFCQAQVIAESIFGNGKLLVYEEYPYWTDEEIAEILTEHYKDYFAKKIKKNNGGN